MTLLDIKNLSVEFHTRQGNFIAVDDISFEINTNET